MKIFIALIFAAALTGCATSQKFVTKMDMFIGQPEVAVISTYGMPQGSYALQDGSKVLQYTRANNLVIPGAVTTQPVTTTTNGNITMNQGMRQTYGNYTQQSTSYVQSQAPATNIALSCTVMFTVDAGGIIRRWSANGNHCVSQ